ncbi:hypothetical protein GC167_04905 [bacterium]|nr:hypothetical protein [bacterium]
MNLSQFDRAWLEFGMSVLLAGLLWLLWRNHRIRKGQIKLANEIESLMEAELVLGKSLALLAHHISAPFHYARSISGVLCERWDELDPTERRSTVHLLRDHLDELTDQFDRVLAWARTKTAGQSTLEPVAIGSFSETELGRLRPAATHKGVRLELALFRDDRGIFDSQAVSLVLQNLLSNALKYSTSGQTIFLEVSGKPGRAIRFVVRDEAGGIGPEELGHLFSGRNHLSKAGTAREKGSGIGLLLTQEVLLGLKSSLVAQSTPQSGSEFSFTVPIEPSPG